jgi:hypothetical protein
MPVSVVPLAGIATAHRIDLWIAGQRPALPEHRRRMSIGVMPASRTMPASSAAITMIATKARILTAT